jgi:hypothetical protein
VAARAAETQAQAKMASLPDADIPVADSCQSSVAGPEQTTIPRQFSLLTFIRNLNGKAGEA